MLNFTNFIKEWEFEPANDSGHPVGKTVKINQPGHANHGKTGRIVRHQGTDSLVDFGGGTNPSWHNRLQHLK